MVDVKFGDELLARLAAPFEEHEIKWRAQSSGKKADNSPWVRVLAYIDNAAIMARLDAVCGCGGWSNRFEQFDGGVICGLSIYVGGQWIIKWDGSGATQTEPFKGALSGAMKRAAVQWGIGRYLHGMGELYATITTANDRNGHYLKANPEKHGPALKWLPPKLPARYLPSSAPVPVQPAARTTMAKVGEVVATVAPAAAAADPAVDPVAEARRAIGAAGQVRLPGTNKSLMGFGGSEILAVPREHLPVIRERLLASRPEHYTKEIAAIEEYLEATRTD